MAQLFRLVAEWNDWEPGACLSWDEERSCHRCAITCKDSRPRDFKFCTVDDENLCLYPDRARATIHGDDCDLRGPDGDGAGKFWSIGAHPFDEVAAGARFEVRLFADRDTKTPQRLDWEVLPAWPPQRLGTAGAPPVAPANSYHIVGSWNQWSEAAEAEWDPERWCFRHFIQLGGAGAPESFQFLQAGMWGLCLHPDRSHASCHGSHELCGPDSHGHDKNWCIGMHALDGAAARSVFEIRLHIGPTGRPSRVDWVRLSAGFAPKRCSKAAADARGAAAANAESDVSAWRELAAACREEGDTASLAQTLQAIAEIEMRCQNPRGAVDAAEECASLYASLGSRWRRGIALHTLAKARAGLADGAESTGAAGAHLQAAMSDCEQAVQLLRLIGNASEEKDLAAARTTLGAIRTKLEQAGIPSAASQLQDSSRHDCGATTTKSAASAAKVGSTQEDIQTGAAYAIVGTWDSWESPRAMRWDAERGIFVFVVSLAPSSVSEFQILMDADWSKRLHPDRPRASPQEAHTLCGPEPQGDDLNWELGPPVQAADQSSNQRNGIPFEIQLRLDGRGKPAKVSTVELDHLTCELLAWQAEVARLRSSGIGQESGRLADALCHTASLLLECRGSADEAARLAAEAARLLEACGSRWRTGIAWSIAAKARLLVLQQSTASDGADASAVYASLVDNALQAATEAVTLLSKVGDAQEEEDLLAARATFIALLSSLPPALELAEAAAASQARLLLTAAKRFLESGLPAEAAEAADAAFVRSQRAGLEDHSAEALLATAEARVLILELSLAARSPKSSADTAVECAERAVAAMRSLYGNDAEEVVCACCILGKARVLKHALEGIAAMTAAPEAKREDCKLQRTFGYALGLKQNASFARFDIRRDICMAVGGFEHGEVVLDAVEGTEYIAVGVAPVRDGLARALWFQPAALSRLASCCFSTEGSSLKAAFSSAANQTKRQVREAHPEDFDLAEDSDGEMIALCHECLLPLGSTAYKVEEARDGVHSRDASVGQVHGECKAELIMAKAKKESQAKTEERQSQKQEENNAYGIGWRAEEMVPKAEEFLDGLGLTSGPLHDGRRALFCCILDTDKATNVKALRIARTTDPEAAVVLPYLAVALQVRRQDGIAPYFSLDIPRADRPWQVKTFQPSWLHSTCVGEVMFQADYHLKALSMGGHSQPVAGMGSVWDFPWHQPSWRGREWFVVNDAKVFLSENDVLIPYVRMGVEAREQAVDIGNRVIDAPVTAPDHPLVKYAANFTKYFDLIAERKSVVYYLRELSKASVLAKFLLDNDVYIEEAWWQFPPDTSEAHLDLPLTRHERCYHQVLVSDGVIKQTEGGISEDRVELVGGVDLNVDSFDLVNVVRVTKLVENTEAHSPPEAQSLPALGAVPFQDAMELAQLSTRELRQRIREFGGRPPRGPVDRTKLIAELLRFQRGPTVDGDQAEDTSSQRQADDRGLGKGAEAGSIRRLEEELQKLSLPQEMVREVLLAAKRAGFGDATTEEDASAFSSFSGFMKKLSSKFAKDLCEAIFHHSLSDRNRDGASFIPPALSSDSYIELLEDCIAAEKKVRAERRDAFLATSFDMDNPGPLFPSSWKPTFKVCYGRSSTRGNLRQESGLDGSSLLSGEAIFDNWTEDGERYRVYRESGVEVRSVTLPGCEEQADVVYEIQAKPQPPAQHPVVKVLLLVQDASAAGGRMSGSEAVPMSGDSDGASSFIYFIVFETDLGDSILTELGSDGIVRWEENPVELEDRYRKARILRAADCAAAGLQAGTLQSHCCEAALNAAPASLTSRKYADRIFSCALATSKTDIG